MDPRIDEIADRIWRISIFVPDVPPAGFTFNQFVIDGEEPMLYHTGMRQIFPLVSAAVDKTVGLDRLRWIAFSHIEADECGALNQFLAAAAHAQVAHGPTGVTLSIADMADRAPLTWMPDERLDIGGRVLTRRMRSVETPHVPHNWEAQVVFEEETATLFCGDLGTQIGNGAAVVQTSIVEQAVRAESIFGQLSSPVAAAATLRELAELSPDRLAIMHGSSFAGDASAELHALANAYEAMAPVPA
ncbi:MAG TPA: hypothetical protein VFZ37_12610 [Jiangellaceae bacterium]